MEISNKRKKVQPSVKPLSYAASVKASTETQVKRKAAAKSKKGKGGGIFGSIMKMIK